MYDPQKVIAVARAEIGYLEKASNKDLDSKTANAGNKNWNKYARDLAAHGFYNGSKGGVSWCDIFCDAVYMYAYGYEAMCKMTNQKPGAKNYGAGCKYSMQYYKQMGRLFKSPQPGDQIFFYPANGIGGSEIAHTGIVEKVTGSKVYTIEGNTSSAAGVVANGGCVRAKSYSLSYARIAGYGRPKWDCDGVPAPAPTPEPVKETPAATRAATKTAEPKVIWDYLMKQIGNPFGVAGLMGNLKAESALRSINLQQSYEKKLGYTDDSYTDAVDSGKYTGFASDKAGYGLAQWTSGGRKKNLLAYAKETNSSIGNLQMQLEFLMQELRGSYKAVLSVLKNAKSVREASDAVLLKFEIPANRGEAVQLKRASYGEAYYDQYVGIAVETPAETIKKGSKGAAVKEMQKLLLKWKPDCLPKYGADGDWGTETDDALRAFQAAAGVPVNGIYDETTAGLLKGWGTVKYVTVNAGKSVNVRSKADTTGKILGVAHGGDKLPYVATADTGWFNIMFDGVSAYISNKYSRIS